MGEMRGNSEYYFSKIHLQPAETVMYTVQQQYINSFQFPIYLCAYENPRDHLQKSTWKRIFTYVLTEEK